MRAYSIAAECWHNPPTPRQPRLQRCGVPPPVRRLSKPWSRNTPTQDNRILSNLTFPNGTLSYCAEQFLCLKPFLPKPAFSWKFVKFVSGFPSPSGSSHLRRGNPNFLSNPHLFRHQSWIRRHDLLLADFDILLFVSGYDARKRIPRFNGVLKTFIRLVWWRLCLFARLWRVIGFGDIVLSSACGCRSSQRLAEVLDCRPNFFVILEPLAIDFFHRIGHTLQIFLRGEISGWL